MVCNCCGIWLSVKLWNLWMWMAVSHVNSKFLWNKPPKVWEKNPVIWLLCVAAACASEEMISQILGILFSGSTPTLVCCASIQPSWGFTTSRTGHCWKSFSGGRVEESKELSRVTLGEQEINGSGGCGVLLLLSTCQGCCFSVLFVYFVSLFSSLFNFSLFCYLCPGCLGVQSITAGGGSW